MTTIDTTFIEGDELKRDFCAAVYLIRNYEGSYTPTVDEKLKFYGLYKQATEGDCNSDTPGFFQGVTAHYKWEAWSKLSGTSSTAAAAEYVAILSQGWPEWREAVPKDLRVPNDAASATSSLPSLAEAGSAAANATPPPRSFASLPSTAPAAAAAAAGSTAKQALSERISRLRGNMQASMSAVQSLEASVSQLEQRATPARGTPARRSAAAQRTPAQTPPTKSNPAEAEPVDRTAQLMASVTEQAARIAAVAASGQAAGASGHLGSALQHAVRFCSALWRRILAHLQPVLLTAATVLNAPRLRKLLPALLKPVHAAIQTLGAVLQGMLARAGLPHTAQWVKVAAQQLQGGLKALESKVPPGAAGAVFVLCLLSVAYWQSKDLIMQLLVWLIS